MSAPAFRWEWLRAVTHEHAPFSANARHFAHALAFLWMDPDGWCFPGIRTVAEHMNRNKDTVRAAVAELKTAGFLRVEKGGRWPGDYQEYQAVLPGVEWLDPLEEGNTGRTTRRRGRTTRQTGRMVRQKGSNGSDGTNQGTNQELTKNPDETLSRSSRAVGAVNKPSGKGTPGPCVVCERIDVDAGKYQGGQWWCHLHAQEAA